MIENWSKQWGFKVSDTKKYAVLFTRKQNIKTDNLNLTLFGKKIEFVKQIELLGLTFDSQLKWDAHITHLKEACKKDLNLLR